MIPHEMFAAILRALAAHGIGGDIAAGVAHTIMDEFEAAS